MKTLLKSPVSWIAIGLCFATAFAWGADDLAPGPGPGPVSAASTTSSPSPSPSPSASPSPSPSVIALNPDNLRTLMVQGNPSLVTALNQVYQAKDKERVARADLLPGASVNAILGSTTGPAFIMSAVEFLAPFLVPSNWFNYEASQQNYNAELASYNIVELNEYASIYALYETVVQDENLVNILQEQVNDWSETLENLQGQNAISGSVPEQDIKTATYSADSAEQQLQAMQAFIAGDIAALQYALGLDPLKTTIKVDPTTQGADIAQSENESDSLADASAYAFSVSPEIGQLNDLIAASNMGQWSDTFAIIGTPSFMAGNPYSAGGSILPDLSQGQVRGSFDFGFAAFPQYSLDQDQIEAIQISLQQEKATLTETLQTTLTSLSLAEQELTESKDAENNMEDSYDIEKFRYDQGESNITNLLTNRNQLTLASIARAQAQGQVDQLRITLERTMLENEFSPTNLPGCKISAAAPENILQIIGDAIASIFSSTHDHATLDQVCRIAPS